ncbi:hypothetical protein D3C73_1326640 [compost metagenome]
MALRFVAVLDQHRPQHAQAERHDAGRGGQRAFVIEDEFLRGAPAGAAVFHGPVAGQPALLVQDGVPFNHVVFREQLAQPNLVGKAPGQLGRQEGAHVVAEGVFFGGEFQVHVGP